MIQMVNHLSIRKKILGKIEEIPAQGGAQIDAKQPLEDPLPPLNIEVTIPLKYLSNFWRELDLPLINWEV